MRIRMKGRSDVKLGIVQMAVAVTIIVLAMLTQLVPGLDSGRGNGRPDSDGPTLGAYSRALAQDDNEDGDNDEDDNEDGDNDEDNEDEDNEDDNEDEDNEDGDADNDDEDPDNED